MNKFKKILIFTLIALKISYSAESKILSTIQQFLPTPTEIGYLTGIVNCYIQVSQFVRATNKVVGNVKQAKSQWDRLTDQISYMYESVKALKDVDPYDLNSWRQVVNQSQLLLTSELAEAARLYGNTEYYLIDSPIEYLQEIETPQMFEDFQNRTGVNVKKYYNGPAASSVENDTKTLREFYGLLETQARTKILQIDAQLNLVTSSKTYAELNEEEKIEYDKLNSSKKDLEKELLGFNRFQKEKIDTILEECRSLITVNLTEIVLAEKRIQRMEEAASEMIDSYERLIQGNVATKRLEDNTDVLKGILTEDDTYGSHANQVPFPQAPKEVKSAMTNKKVPNQQDAVALQNNIKYIMSKQEALYRDIAAMKVNTMSFIVAYEALKQYRTENQAIYQSASYSHLSERVVKK